MTTQSTKYAVCLGLAGSLAFAIAPAVQAEIAVTGGRTSGDAAFFVPKTGNTVLFDINTRLIKLETPNGVTVNSRFTPSAGRLDPTTGVPKGGETGRLEGTLSGRAFTPAGQPFFFQDIKTILDFKLTSFDYNRVMGGSLISPSEAGSAPVIFLPSLNASLSSESSSNFQTQSGQLYVGSFAANLPKGSIDLPSDVKFTMGTDFIEFDGTKLTARADTKFKLEGRGDKNSVTTISADDEGSGGKVSFSTDNSTTTFKIEGTVKNPKGGEISSTDKQSEGDNSVVKLAGVGSKFRIEGNLNGPTSFDVSGVPIQGVDATLKGQTKFQLEGNGNGTTVFDASKGGISYTSDKSTTNVRLQGNGLSVDAQATGKTSFTIGAVGLNSNVSQSSSSSSSSALADTSSSSSSDSTSRLSGLSGKVSSTPLTNSTTNTSGGATTGSSTSSTTEPSSTTATTPATTTEPSSTTATTPATTTEPSSSTTATTPATTTEPSSSTTTTPTTSATGSSTATTPSTSATDSNTSTPSTTTTPTSTMSTSTGASGGAAPATTTTSSTTSSSNTLLTITGGSSSTPSSVFTLATIIRPDAITPVATTSQSTTINVFTLSSFSGSSGSVYSIFGSGQGEIKVRLQKHGRGLALGRNARTYVIVGSPSRVFPGLVGVRQLPAVTTPTSTPSTTQPTGTQGLPQVPSSSTTPATTTPSSTSAPASSTTTTPDSTSAPASSTTTTPQ